MASELGTEVTFNPQGSIANAAVKLDGEEFDQLSDLSCPSATLCETVSQGRQPDQLRPADRGEDRQRQADQRMSCLASPARLRPTASRSTTTDDAGRLTRRMT